MTCFLLEKVPEQFWSFVQNIKLVGISPSQSSKLWKLVRSFRSDSLFSVDRMRRNWNNISLQKHEHTNNGTYIIFSVSTLYADNLASHFVGEFQTPVKSTTCLCRRCPILNAERLLSMSLSERCWRAGQKFGDELNIRSNVSIPWTHETSSPTDWAIDRSFSRRKAVLWPTKQVLSADRL